MSQVPFQDLKVGSEYDVQFDDGSPIEFSFRARLVEKGAGVMLFSNGVLLRADATSDFPVFDVEDDSPHDGHLLERMRRA